MQSEEEFQEQMPGSQGDESWQPMLPCNYKGLLSWAGKAWSSRRWSQLRKALESQSRSCADSWALGAHSPGRPLAVACHWPLLPLGFVHRRSGGSVAAEAFFCLVGSPAACHQVIGMITAKPKKRGGNPREQPAPWSANCRNKRIVSRQGACITIPNHPPTMILNGNALLH